MRTALICGLLLVLAAGGVPAQKTPVSVEFELKESTYRQLFTPDELKRVERGAAELLAGSLRERLPVLDLRATDSADHRLVVSLDLRGGDQANPLQADRGFYARLIAPDSATEATWWTLFRRASQATEAFGGSAGAPLERRFLEHVRLAVVQADVDPLIRDHLSRVPIAEDGRIWTPPPGEFGWVAARERDDLCLALDSGLRVLVLVPNPFAAGLRPRMYEARVEGDFDPSVVFGSDPPPEFAFGRGFFIRPDPADQAGLDQVQASSGARVQAFYLAHFVPDRSICEPLPSPMEAEAGVGGGR